MQHIYVEVFRSPIQYNLLSSYSKCCINLVLIFLRSGGMSNELNNILSIHTDGVYEGVAIGGDRYPVSTFIDHLLRYQVFLL